jgi:acetyl-CoA acetyltransferase family protein
MSIDVVLAAGRRTPLGVFGGALASVPMTDLAVHAVHASLAAARLEPRAIDHIVFSTTVPSDRDSLFGPRVVGVKAGLPEEAGALGVTRACASGLQAMLSAHEQVANGHSQLAIACGAESYSRAPYAATTMRWGAKRGPHVLDDMLEWAYRCPFSLEYMGETAENLAADYQHTREAMDAWGAMSQQRALAARDSGFLARQIAPIEIRDGKTTKIVEHDEGPRRDATPAKLATLKPSFRDGGRVTAGSSSLVNDGAAAMLVGEMASFRRHGVTPEARIVDWAVVGVPPRIMGSGPVPAIRKLLGRTRLTLDAIDYVEINEAFAVVNLHAERELGIPRDKHNLYGGGISIGHPPAVTGLRMAMTAIHHLADTRGRYAILSMCLGAGQGMAMLIENLRR